MSFVVDVFVGNYPVIDWELYSLWVEGECLLKVKYVSYLYKYFRPYCNRSNSCFEREGDFYSSRTSV